MGRLLPLPAIAIALLATAFGGARASEDDPIAPLQAAFTRAVKPGEAADHYRELFPTVLQRVQRSYAKEVDVQALTASAMKAMAPLPEGAGEPRTVFASAMRQALRTLDPYSRFIDAEAHANERSEATGVFGGLGIEVEARDGAVRVIAPTPGGPAARAGVQAGDLIVRLGDESLLGLPLNEAVSRMRGAPGTPITLTVKRTEQELTISLTREVIRRQVLRWYMEGDALVLRLATFSGAATAALEQAVGEALAKHQPTGVVLDMRGNGGGLLLEAIRTADAFLAQGDIVSLRGRTPGNQRTWRADAEELLPGLPMVVLVDGRSASASELVAAALQENGRATVMGQRSFGKGSVQSTYALGDNKGAVKLTSAFYIGPSGRSVNQAGVVPDIEVVVDAAQAAAGAKARVDASRCAASRTAADPVLSCALSYFAAGSVDAFASAFVDTAP